MNTTSLTITFSGTTSVLYANFLPEIILDEKFDYSCAVLDLYIKNTTVNKLVLNNVIRIDCDIISGSYINGERNQTIHQFIAGVSIGSEQTFREIPKNLNYLPVKTKSLRRIHLSIVDSKGKLVNFQGAELICRLNIKREQQKND